MTRWFRHYEGLVNDPKLGSVAHRAATSLPNVVYVWCAILEAAAKCNAGGTLHLDTHAIAFSSGIDIMTIDTIIHAMEAADLITNDGEICVTHWKDRQFESDSSRDRVRAFRARKAQKQACNVTPPLRNGDGTAPENREERTSTVEGSLRSPSTSEAPGGASLTVVRNGDAEASSPADAQFYRRCKEVLGDKKGGMIGTKLLRAKKGVHALARAAIEQASTKADPEEYVWAVIRGRSEEEKADRNWIDPRLGA